MREGTQTRHWLQQLGGKSKAECKATKSKATKSKATKSKAKSKAKSDTSPATPEGWSIQHEFTKWYLYPGGYIQSGPLSPGVTEAD